MYFRWKCNLAKLMFGQLVQHGNHEYGSATLHMDVEIPMYRSYKGVYASVYNCITCDHES